MWKALRRAGHDIGRDQTARLMRELGLQGARRGRKRFTTTPDAKAGRPPDLVDRHFDPTDPNRLWVLDITYVPTWTHVAYVCFIIDAFSRRIVGWRVATNMRTDMVLDALEMAAWARGTQLGGLVCHSDAGSQGGLNRPSQHLDLGGVDDDNARTAAGGAALPRPDPFTGPADGRVAARPGCVLGSDRPGREDRGRCSRSGGVIPRCVPLVPSRWRSEPLPATDGHGPLPVLR
jgi:hypothetical protein